MQLVQALKYIGQDQLAISVITQAELYYGALNKAELQKIKQHLALLNHFPVTPTISNIFLNLMKTYALSDKLSLPDAFIAATALAHNVELYTLNTKDFQFIPDLKLYQQ